MSTQSYTCTSHRLEDSIETMKLPHGSSNSRVGQATRVAQATLGLTVSLGLVVFLALLLVAGLKRLLPLHVHLEGLNVDLRFVDLFLKVGANGLGFEKLFDLCASPLKCRGL